MGQWNLGRALGVLAQLTCSPTSGHLCTYSPPWVLGYPLFTLCALGGSSVTWWGWGGLWLRQGSGRGVKPGCEWPWFLWEGLGQQPSCPGPATPPCIQRATEAARLSFTPDPGAKCTLVWRCTCLRGRTCPTQGLTHQARCCAASLRVGPYLPVRICISPRASLYLREHTLSSKIKLSKH